MSWGLQSLLIGLYLYVVKWTLTNFKNKHTIFSKKFKTQSLTIFVIDCVQKELRGRRGRITVGFKTTYAISAYHHYVVSSNSVVFSGFLHQ